MSKPTHPMSVLLRPTLAAALAFGLAAAPSAQAVDQADDQDEPGALSAPATLGLATVDLDDRDPGALPFRTDVRTFSREAVDLDADARTALAPAPLAIEGPVGRLDDGRDGAPMRALAAAPFDGPLDDGRDPNAPVALRLTPAYDGPLDDGRPEGARRAVVADEADTPVREAAPQAAVEAAPEGPALSLVRPNPARDRAELTFTLEAPGPATVRVYDVRGREVAVAFDGPAPADAPQTVGLDVSALAPGTYVAVLSVSGRQTSRTFQVVR